MFSKKVQFATVCYQNFSHHLLHQITFSIESSCNLKLLPQQTENHNEVKTKINSPRKSFDRLVKISLPHPADQNEQHTKQIK